MKNKKYPFALLTTLTVAILSGCFSCSQHNACQTTGKTDESETIVDEDTIYKFHIRDTHLYDILREGFVKFNIPARCKNTAGFFPPHFRYGNRFGYIDVQDTLIYDNQNDTIVIVNQLTHSDERKGYWKSYLLSSTHIEYLDYNRTMNSAQINMSDSVEFTRKGNMTSEEWNKKCIVYEIDSWRSGELFKKLQSWDEKAVRNEIKSLGTHKEEEGWICISHCGARVYYLISRVIIKEGDVERIDTISNLPYNKTNQNIKEWNDHFFYGKELPNDPFKPMRVVASQLPFGWYINALLNYLSLDPEWR